jgi:hypothetical protein
MNHIDIEFLQAQSQSLTQLLEQLPADEILERTGLQSRLDEVRSQLADLSAQDMRPSPAVVELTFRGNPVSGFFGIKADFAAKAVAAFERAVATMDASLLPGELRDAGRVPERASHQLLITGCVSGSFGFRLEEMIDERAQMDLESATVAEAVQQVMTILEACLTSDERLVDALGEASARVLVPIKDFLTVLHHAQATCAISMQGTRFRFESSADVETALERSMTGVEEKNETFTGRLRGILPDSRTFDFKTDADQLLSGKVDRRLGELDELRTWVDLPSTASVLVRSAGRVRSVRRYTLQALTPRS